MVILWIFRATNLTNIGLTEWLIVVFTYHYQTAFSTINITTTTTTTTATSNLIDLHQTAEDCLHAPQFVPQLLILLPQKHNGLIQVIHFIIFSCVFNIDFKNIFKH